MCGKAAHMHFVNDGARPRPFQGSISLPVIRLSVRNNTFHGGSRVIAGVAGGLAAVVSWDSDRPAIGIEKYLG